jgi:hypothetical protein
MFEPTKGPKFAHGPPWMVAEPISDLGHDCAQVEIVRLKSAEPRRCHARSDERIVLARTAQNRRDGKMYSASS